MKKLLTVLTVIILSMPFANAQLKAGMFAGASPNSAIVGVQAGVQAEDIYLNFNLIGEASAIEPSSFEVRINYTKYKLGAYIGFNSLLWSKSDEKGLDYGKRYNFTYGLQFRGSGEEGDFYRFDRAYITLGMVGNRPMLLLGGAIALN